MDSDSYFRHVFNTFLQPMAKIMVLKLKVNLKY